MEQEKDKAGCPEGMVRRGGKCVMPEVTFTTLIMSLNSSALYHMGAIEAPGASAALKNRLLARHSIDTIALLQEKTKGNLSDDEGSLLRDSLLDLRLRYVTIFADEDV